MALLSLVGIHLDQLPQPVSKSLSQFFHYHMEKSAQNLSELEMISYHTDCRYWSGYNPCLMLKEGKTEGCLDCQLYAPIRQNILVIKTGGLGSIVRMTVLTRILKEEFPESFIHWYTDKRAAPLLENVPSVDNIIVDENSNHLIVLSQEFDLAINFDSRLTACMALMRMVKAKEKIGFLLNQYGKLSVSSQSTLELLRLQIDDHFRSKVNQKSMQQIFVEAIGRRWEDQHYDLSTKTHDDHWAHMLLKHRGVEKENGYYKIVGLNVGSRQKTDVKRWPAERFYELSKILLHKYPHWKVILLGGPDDMGAISIIRLLNEAHPLSNLIIGDLEYSMSQFISLVNLTPIIVSADTFGAHVAIGMKKQLVLLSGPQPAQEIELYGRGIKLSLNLGCSPCFAYKAYQCLNPNKVLCMIGIDIAMVQTAVEDQIEALYRTTLT